MLNEIMCVTLPGIWQCLVATCYYYYALYSSEGGQLRGCCPGGSGRRTGARQGVKGDGGLSRGYYLSARTLGGPDTWVQHGFLG